MSYQDTFTVTNYLSNFLGSINVRNVVRSRIFLQSYLTLPACFIETETAEDMAEIRLFTSITH